MKITASKVSREQQLAIGFSCIVGQNLGRSMEQLERAFNRKRVQLWRYMRRARAELRLGIDSATTQAE